MGPQFLQIVDLDGNGVAEIVFAHQSAIWILNDKGQTIVRAPTSWWVTLLRAEDRDHDKRAELYVRTQGALTRYDLERER